MKLTLLAMATGLSLITGCSTTTTSTTNDTGEEIVSSETTIFQTNIASTPKVEINNECLPYTVVENGTIIGFKARYFKINEDTALKVPVQQTTCAVQLLQKYPLKVELQGFTDSSGSKSYNQQLAKHRSQSIQAELISNGVEPQSIMIVESAQIMKNKGMQALNRRVSLTLK